MKNKLVLGWRLKMKTSKSLQENCVHFIFRSSLGKVFCKMVFSICVKNHWKVHVNEFIFDKVAVQLLVTLLKNELFHSYYSWILQSNYFVEHIYKNRFYGNMNFAYRSSQWELLDTNRFSARSYFRLQQVCRYFLRIWP